MIRLTSHKSLAGNTEIRVEGRLDATSLNSLQDLVSTTNPATTVDLSGITSVDREGGALLLRLRNAGFRLRGGSLYITRLLEEH